MPYGIAQSGYARAYESNATTSTCPACCDDNGTCLEVIRARPCYTHTGDESNPCSESLTPIWFCADIYCANEPFDPILGRRRNIGDAARANVRVTIATRAQRCFVTEPETLKLRSDMTAAELALLQPTRGAVTCASEGCMDSLCFIPSGFYDPCLCLCYAHIEAGDYDNPTLVFCCYGRAGVLETQVPPSWGTQYEYTERHFVSIEHLSPYSWGPCDVGRNQLTRHLVSETIETGQTLGRFVSLNIPGYNWRCCVGGEKRYQRRTFPLLGGIAWPHGGCDSVPTDTGVVVTDQIFCPGAGRVRPEIIEADQGAVGNCQSRYRSETVELERTCTRWRYERNIESFNCTIGPNGVPIARITEHIEIRYVQQWQLGSDPQCGNCDVHLLGIAQQSQSVVAARGDSPTDPRVVAAYLRQFGGCRGCGDH